MFEKLINMDVLYTYILFLSSLRKFTHIGRTRMRDRWINGEMEGIKIDDNYIIKHILGYAQS